MTPVVEVQLWQPTFSGLCADRTPEWPPSPLRLAQALRAGCAAIPDETARRESIEALRALVQRPNPVIRAPNAVRANLPKTYSGRSGSPTTAKELKHYLDLAHVRLSTIHKVEKAVDAMYLDDVTITFEFDDPEGSVDLAALAGAARRVSYFGRSHNGCDVLVSSQAPPESAVKWVPLRQPQRTDGRGQFVAGTSRGWAPNSIEWMDENYELTASGSSRPMLAADAFSTRLRYVQSGNVPIDTTRGQHVLILPLTSPLPGGRTPNVFRELDVDPGGEVRAFPCTFTRHQFADGSLRGIGLAAPSADTARAFATHVIERLDMHTGADVIEGATLAPASWLGPSATWISATPVRAFPDERVLRHVIGGEATELFGIAPGRVLVHRQPVHRWQRRWPQPEDGLRAWWVELEFERKLVGPLQLGASTELGFGLFAPQRVSQP